MLDECWIFLRVRLQGLVIGIYILASLVFDICFDIIIIIITIIASSNYSKLQLDLFRIGE